MSKTQEALRLALEALEAGHSTVYGTSQAARAITAIREALAEQPAQQQEPFAYAYTGIKHNGEHHGPHLVWNPAYMDAMSASMGAVAVPLYTSPQSKPLTDEEIWDEVKAADLDWQTGWSLDEDASNRYITFARAIEAKLREKNA